MYHLLYCRAEVCLAGVMLNISDSTSGGTIELASATIDGKIHILVLHILLLHLNILLCCTFHHHLINMSTQA
jgi:hypothetical protein